MSIFMRYGEGISHPFRRRSESSPARPWPIEEVPDFLLDVFEISPPEAKAEEKEPMPIMMTVFSMCRAPTPSSRPRRGMPSANTWALTNTSSCLSSSCLFFFFHFVSSRKMAAYWLVPPSSQLWSLVAGRNSFRPYRKGQCIRFVSPVVAVSCGCTSVKAPRRTADGAGSSEEPSAREERILFRSRDGTLAS